MFGICTSVWPDRAGFTAPDQLAPALAKTLPTPLRVYRRSAVQFAIPALHRVDAESIADRHSLEFKRRSERRSWTAGYDVVAGHVETQRLHVTAKSVDPFKRAGFGVISKLHIASRNDEELTKQLSARAGRN